MQDGVIDTVTAADEIMEISTDPLAESETADGDFADIAEDNADGDSSDVQSDPTPETDYEAVMAEDLATLKRQFPELRALTDISRLRNPLRYAALRDLGLSAEEAYMAACAPRHHRDSRAHLTSAVPKSSAKGAASMTHGELAVARELFSDMSDAELNSLYRRVTG